MSPGGAANHLNGANVLSYRRDGNTGQQELQLLSNGIRGSNQVGLQAILIEREMQCRYACPQSVLTVRIIGLASSTPFTCHDAAAYRDRVP
jgi:hypothetical protein